jgi:hypothetical protein
LCPRLSLIAPALRTTPAYTQTRLDNHRPPAQPLPTSSEQP